MAVRTVKKQGVAGRNWKRLEAAGKARRTGKTGKAGRAGRAGRAGKKVACASLIMFRPVLVCRQVLCAARR
jgi:hypothetical protein